MSNHGSLRLGAAFVAALLMAILPASVGAQSITIAPGLAAPSPILPRVNELPPNTIVPNTIVPRFLIEVMTDQTPAPDEMFTLRGQGWPASDLLTATLFELGGGARPSGTVGAIQILDDGSFDVQARMPHTVYDANGDFYYVTPGQYTLSLRANSGASATFPVTVGAPMHGALIWGEISLGTPGNVADTEGSEVAVAGAVGIGAGIGVLATGDRQSTENSVSGFSTARYGTGTDARGQYVMWVPAGIYSLQAQMDFGDVRWGAALDVQADQLEIMRAPLVLQPVS